MTLLDAVILGTACAILAVFLTLTRNAWYAAYYNDDGTPKESNNEVH